MGILIDNSFVEKIYMNNNQVKKVMYNGNKVYEFRDSIDVRYYSNYSFYKYDGASEGIAPITSYNGYSYPTTPYSFALADNPSTGKHAWCVIDYYTTFIPTEDSVLSFNIQFKPLGTNQYLTKDWCGGSLQLSCALAPMENGHGQLILFRKEYLYAGGDMYAYPITFANTIPVRRNLIINSPSHIWIWIYSNMSTGVQTAIQCVIPTLTITNILVP